MTVKRLAFVSALACGSTRATRTVVVTPRIRRKAKTALKPSENRDPEIDVDI